MRGYRDLAAVVIAAALCALIAVAVPVEAIRVIAAVPLLFLLPGFALTEAAFADRPPSWPMRPTLTVALSLSVLAIGAVVLQVLPGRFGEASWAVWAVLVTLGAALVAGYRRHSPNASAARGRRRPRPLPHVPLPQAAMLALAALALAATVVLASTVFSAQNAIGYTRLWMLPSQAGARVPHVTIGVENVEHDATVYRLVLDVGGVRSLRRMHLEPGHSRIWRFRTPRRDAGRRTKVRARLYTARNPYKVYRHVTGWIPAR
jgi:uncharacterized membrane protein